MSSYMCDAEHSLLVIKAKILGTPVLFLIFLLTLLLQEEREYTEKGGKLGLNSNSEISSAI